MTGKKLDLNFFRNQNWIENMTYPLSLIDFGTTVYGIFSEAFVDLQGFSGIILSSLIAFFCLWLLLMTRDNLVPSLDRLIVAPIKGMTSKIEQGEIIEIVASTIPSIIVVIIIFSYIVIDFWTSYLGVSTAVQFKGLLGIVLKLFMVFCLVFSTIYIAILKPKQN